MFSRTRVYNYCFFALSDSRPIASFITIFVSSVGRGRRLEAASSIDEDPFETDGFGKVLEGPLGLCDNQSFSATGELSLLGDFCLFPDPKYHPKNDISQENLSK